MTEPANDDLVRRAGELFDEISGLAPESRRAALEQRCATDAELRREVESLIASAERAGTFLERPVLGSWVKHTPQLAAGDVPETPPWEEAGEIGPYRLLDRLGEGGFGVVYLAEQRAPLQRRVALKIIKPGMDSREVVARFEAERQALALLDHEGIARIYDAGATHGGRPYFVMEYVRGEPITDYCDRNRLKTRERLELMVRVCEAVQHAHQKGIIHRDLKPSNVLVTEIDRRAVPKVIDFGIAKALSQKLTDRTLHTERGQLIGTPVYMSPEQAGMSALEVDTRTDVYSLGALLYQLLTGVPPFDPKVFSSGGLLEVQRMIREQEPPRPSSRVLKAAGEASPHALAERRRTEPRALARVLRGELDWIVMKALEKDRARRYGFVSDLAADLVRHLEHRPVSAGPPSGAYILRKFVRRHRALVVSSAIALLSLVVGLLMATVGLLRSQRSEQAALREAAKASEVSELMRQMLAAPNPYQGLSRDVTVREVLDGAASRFDVSLRDQPEVEATLRLTIGSTYRDLGDLERAEPQIRRAVQLRREHGSAAELGEALRELGLLLHGSGHLLEAEQALRESVTLLEQPATPPAPARAASAVNALAEVLVTRGSFEAGEQQFRRALALAREQAGADGTLAASILINLGRLLEQLRRFDEAERVLQEAMTSSAGAPSMAMHAQAELAGLAADRGDLARAADMYRRAVEIATEQYGPEHVEVATFQSALGQVLQQSGHAEEAEQLLRRAVETFRARTPAGSPGTVNALTNLAFVLQQKGDLDEAARDLDEALAIARRVLGARHPTVGHVRQSLAGLARARGDRAAAEEHLREAHAIFRESFGDDSPWTLSALSALAQAVLARGDAAGALPLLEQAVAAAARAPGGDGPRDLRLAHARCLITLGRHDDAEAELESIYDELTSESATPGDRRADDVVKMIVDCLVASGREDEAAEWRARLGGGQ